MTVDGQNFAKCSASASAFLFSGGVKNEKGALSKTTENDVIKWSIGEKISVSVSVSVSLLTSPRTQKKIKSHYSSQKLWKKLLYNGNKLGCMILRGHLQ
jgi:hypothetical protein